MFSFWKTFNKLQNLNRPKIIDRKTTFLIQENKESKIVFGKNVTIEPHVVIQGPCKIGDDVTIKSFSYLQNCIIGNNICIGPFAKISDNTKIGDECQIGSFVEIKNSKLGPKNKAKHFGVISMCNTGEDVNFGAGSVFCNFDGIKKHFSTVEDGVFVGGNSTIVSPVKLGKNCFIAAGSTINKDVPENFLAIARSRQENKEKKPKHLSQNKKDSNFNNGSNEDR